MIDLSLESVMERTLSSIRASKERLESIRKSNLEAASDLKAQRKDLKQMKRGLWPSADLTNLRPSF